MKPKNVSLRKCDYDWLKNNYKSVWARWQFYCFVIANSYYFVRIYITSIALFTDQCSGALGAARRQHSPQHRLLRDTGENRPQITTCIATSLDLIVQILNVYMNTPGIYFRNYWNKRKLNNKTSLRKLFVHVY